MEKQPLLSKAGVEVVENQKARMALITLVAFLISASYKVHGPLMTQYVEQVFTQQIYGNASKSVQVSKEPCVDNGNVTKDLLGDEVQDRSADYLSDLNLISGGIAITVNLFLGAYSDYLGRKMVLLLPMVGTFFRNAAAPVIIHWDLGLHAMYFGYVMDGICGGISGVLLGLYVYTSDITKSTSQRTIGLALTETSMGLGVTALNVVTGIFIEDTGYFYPALTACLLVLACILIVAFLLPETLPPERKHVVSPLASVKHLIGTFRARGNPYRQALLLLGLLAFLISTLPNMNTSTIVNLYFMAKPFCWSAIRIGLFGTAWDGSGLLASLTVIKVLSAPSLVVIASLAEAGQLVLLGFAKNDLMVYMVPVVGAVRKMLYPSVRSFMSRLVRQDRQGALFAGIAVVESVCYCLGTYAFMNIYKDTMSFMRGFVFFAIAACMLVVAFIFLLVDVAHVVLTLVVQFNLSRTNILPDIVSVIQDHHSGGFSHLNDGLE